MAIIRDFMFTTGIENSYPVITGRNGQDLRRDEMESCGHYEHWREDFALVRELGIKYLRYGPPYYKTHLGPGRYDWEFADKTFDALRRSEIEPIADLCHFGVPDWVGGFQNKDWPPLFAEYVAAFCTRFPWVRFYTPVNEIRICCTQSALHGHWNERLKSEKAMVTAATNMVRATILAEEAILVQKPEALFVLSEATSYFHPRNSQAQQAADLHNEKRFLELDLCYGYDVTASMYEYLMDHGVSRDEYHWFQQHGRALRSNCIMGNDYYASNEKMVDPDGKASPSGEIFGYYVITKQYYERYHLPVMYTETNNLNDGSDSRRWLNKEWANMLRLKRDGVPITGFTWYSLTDQIDWNTALTQDNGHVDKVGLCDLERQIQPVGRDYRELIRDWQSIMSKAA